MCVCVCVCVFDRITLFAGKHCETYAGILSGHSLQIKVMNKTVREIE